MACKLSVQHDLVYRCLKYALPEDTIDVNHTLKGIHTLKKDYKSQSTKCSPWGAEVQQYPSLRKKMVEFMHQRQSITTPNANKNYQLKTYQPKTYHPKLKTTPNKRDLIPLPKPDRSKLAKPRKVNIHKPTFPGVTGNPINWKSTRKSLIQGDIDVACSASTNLAPVKGSQLMNTPSTPLSTSSAAPAKITEHSKYCATCTPLGKDCPEKFTMSTD